MVEINYFKRYPWLGRLWTGLLALLAFLPALFIARLIARYGVDIPYADEWAWAPFLFKAHQHSLTLVDFFSQHNEHRYFFPKLILLVLAPLTSGNTKGAMFFSFALVVLISALLWYLLSRTVRTSVNKRLLLLGLLNLILFSPVQAENWTWGYQFVLFLTNLLLVAGISVAVSRYSILTKFFVCLAIAGVATFSFGGGVVLWPVTFPLAVALENRRRRTNKILWLLAWLCAAGALVALYFFHYTKPPYHPPLVASSHLVDYFLYITTFLGGHLARADRAESIFLASAFGTLLLCLYLGGLLWTIRARDSGRRKVLPWLSLGSYAVISAGLAAATRIGFGVNQGLDSRYTTFSLCMSLAVIGMLAVAMTSRSHRETDGRHLTGLRWFGNAWLLTACPTLLLLGYLNSSWWGIGSIQQARRNRLHGKAALLFNNVLDAGAVYSMYLIANPTQTKPWANMANSLGYIHPPLIESPELSKLNNHPQLAGFFETLNPKQPELWEASGWAVIPKGFRPADAILLAFDDAEKGPVAFAVASPTVPRPHLIEALHDPRYEYSGWSCEFARSKVPAGDRTITAWAFDADRMVLYPLITTQTLR